MTDQDAGGRNVVIGGGPFQPPARSDLADARRNAAEQKVRADRLAADLIDLRALVRVESADDLSRLLARALPGDGGEITVDTNGDGDLTVTVEELTIDDDGDIVSKVQEFEVEFDVTLRGTFSVNAKDESEADDIVMDAFADFVSELRSAEIVHAEIDSIDVEVDDHYRFTG
ncbi:MAG: hypothetical protein LC650_00610 [Actinobacteria bacterium]|nr:hypothetical protein [Actinomycetota bacterium]